MNRLFPLAAGLFMLIFAGNGQNSQEQKHLTIATKQDGRSVHVSARDIERGGTYPSIVRLAGNVEIRKSICGGYMIVRAERAEVHEDTGEIAAHGEVSVTESPAK